MAVGLLSSISLTHTEGKLEKAAGQPCESRDSADICVTSPHAHSQAGKTRLGVPNCKGGEEGDTTFQTPVRLS